MTWGGVGVDTPYAPDHAIRVAIKSERRLFRDALATCVAAQPEFSVVGHVADVNDLLFLVDLRRPDVVLFDLGPSVRPTVDDLLALRERFDLAHVVLVYERLNPAELAAVWQAGVGTVVPCSHGLDALLVVLQRYAAGHAEFDGPPSEGAAGLTDQEREIITLVSAGHTAVRIAELLDISLHTVDNCKRRIYQKLEVGSQSHAVARAAVLGIVERPILPLNRVNEPNGGALYAVVGGRDSPTRQAVVSTLRDAGIAFSVHGSMGRNGPAGADSPRTPTLLVLVDPDGTDWPDVDAPQVPVVLVHGAPLCKATVISALVRGLAGIVPGDRVIQELVPVLRLTAHGHRRGLGPPGRAGERPAGPDRTGVRHPAVDRVRPHRTADRALARHRGEDRGEHPGQALPQARRAQPGRRAGHGVRPGPAGPAAQVRPLR
jgi:two-component system, NarL family, nitrate/nitrite response regulator NarL